MNVFKTTSRNLAKPVCFSLVLALGCLTGTELVSGQSRRLSGRSQGSVQNRVSPHPASGANDTHRLPAPAAATSKFSQATERYVGPPLAPLIPGTGERVDEIFDDFEDPAWAYTFNLPKIFNHGEMTLNKNLPAGISNNQLWYEGPKRGQPDRIERVETPAEGLPGSTGALLLRSYQTGGAYPTRQQQQDDFVCNMNGKTGSIPVAQSPNVVTRVYFPPIDQWERRTGCHFAFRASLDTETPLFSSASHASQSMKIDESWPGIFVNMEIKQPQQPISATNPVRLFLWLKADQRGHQLQGPEITELGWWTFGMSFTKDGQVHYYARKGVENLTQQDHITSSFPYGQNAARLRNFFFNVCSGDDGQTWSTPFVIDDPSLFIIK